MSRLGTFAILLAVVCSSLAAAEYSNAVFNVFTGYKKAYRGRAIPGDSTNDDQIDEQKVAFSVASSTEDVGTKTHTPAKFFEVLTNRQSAFALDRNVFTAPVAGVYAFSFTGRAKGNYIHVYFNLNGQRRFFTVISPSSSAGSFSTLVEMHAGDVAYMSIHPGHRLAACSPACTTFSGYLIHALPTELEKEKGE